MNNSERQHPGSILDLSVANESMYKSQSSVSMTNSRTSQSYMNAKGQKITEKQEKEAFIIRYLLGINYQEQDQKFEEPGRQKCTKKQDIFDIKYRSLCPDSVFGILYALIWVFVIYLIAFSQKYNIKSNSQQFHLFLEPMDIIRRQCGTKQSDQPDVHSPDYSTIIRNFDQSYQFCELLNNMRKDNKTYSIPQIKNFSFECTALVYNNKLSPSEPGNWNTEYSIKFYNQVSQLYNDMTEFDVGFQAKNNICIKQQQQETCAIPQDVQYICHREWNDFIKYALPEDVYNNLTEQTKYTNFVTFDQYQTIVNQIPQTFSFIGKFCTQVPSDYEKKYVEEYKPHLLTKQSINKRCIINYQQALTEAEETDQTLQGYLAYFTQCYKQPVATALLEFDMGWKSLLIDIGMALVISLIFQIIMQFCKGFIMYFVFGVLIAALIVFCVFLFTYAIDINKLNKDYYLKFGQVDSEGQLQEIIFFIIAIIVLLVTIAAFSLIWLVVDLQKGVKQILKVVQSVLKKKLQICLHIILSLFVQLGSLLGMMIVILRFSSQGRYDGETGMFTFNTQDIGESQQHDVKRSLILTLYVLMMVNTFFIIQGSLQFIIGLTSMQYYAYNKINVKMRNQHLFLKRVAYFIRQIGSICAYSMYCTLVMVIQPILAIMAQINSKSGLIEFFKILYCMTKDEVVYTMALTGQNYINSAKIYKEIAFIDVQRMGSIGKLNSMIYNITSLSITCVTKAIRILLVDWFHVKAFEGSYYIWLMIISFILSYVCGYYNNQMNNYILKSQMFIYRYEEYQNNGYILLGDDNIIELRKLIDLK